MTDKEKAVTDVTAEVTLVFVEAGGTNEPGVYWTFDDTDQLPEDEVQWAGPFETEALAVENAQEAIGAAYAAAMTQLFGEA